MTTPQDRDFLSRTRAKIEEHRHRAQSLMESASALSLSGMVNLATNNLRDATYESARADSLLWATLVFYETHPEEHWLEITTFAHNGEVDEHCGGCGLRWPCPSTKETVANVH